MTIDWQAYRADDLWDELVTPAGQPRPGAGRLLKALAELSNDEIRERKTAAELAIRAMGITFTVYDDGAHIDREWPFDIVPRLILKREWDEVARGLKQRVRALNAFIDDVYHHRRALRDGVVPTDYVLKSREYRSRCAGISPPHGVWAHVCGSDLVRDIDGKLYVLEDNLRVPSGFLTCSRTGP